MAKYRHDLPQRHGGIFLTDGGMETTLIFHEGIELPHFAAFVLLDSPEGRQKLKQYYASYLAVARDHGAGFVLDSPTWRANPDWGEKLGYDAAALKAINVRSIAFLRGTAGRLGTAGARPASSAAPSARAATATRQATWMPRKPRPITAAQIAAFVEGGADMVTAYTLNSINEAIGVARAAKAQGIPCGDLVHRGDRRPPGARRNVARGDRDRGSRDRRCAGILLINCAHPTHFEHALQAGEAWIGRIHGVRANASTKSHAELDESETLDAGDPVDLGRRYRNLRGAFPKMRILGGCCGTDHRHAEAICEACVPPALSA